MLYIFDNWPYAHRAIDKSSYMTHFRQLHPWYPLFGHLASGGAVMMYVALQCPDLQDELTFMFAASEVFFRLTFSECFLFIGIN